MTIALNIARPKLESANVVNVQIGTGAVTTAQNNIEMVVEIKGLQSTPSPSFECSYDTSEAEITLTNNTGHPISKYIRLGDLVTGDATAFPLGTEYVTSISEDGTQVTLGINVIPDAVGTAQNLTFTPEAVDSVLYILKLQHNVSGGNVTVTPKLYSFDGTQIRDADADGKDDSTSADAQSSKVFASHVINMDAFLSNARLPRTN